MILAITRLFFQLKTQDFTWKFVWTIQKTGHPYNKKIHGIHVRKISMETMHEKLPQKYDKVFAWKFIWTIQIKWASMKQKISMNPFKKISKNHRTRYN